MLGKTHAATGWCAGLALAPTLGAPTLPQALVVAAVTAGAALLPDLDHPSSSASRFAGPLTAALSAVVRFLSRGLYQITKGSRDERVSGGHRHATHTVLFAVLLGLWINWWTGRTGAWSVLVVLGLAVLLAVDVLGDWLVLVLLGVAGWWISQGQPEQQLAAVSGWIGWAVAAGCLVHCLGDALTRSGCPFLWPLPIAGETWYELRPPELLRFRTGGAVEMLLIWPACVLAGVLLLPGVWPAVVAVISRVVG